MCCIFQFVFNNIPDYFQDLLRNIQEIDWRKIADYRNLLIHPSSNLIPFLRITFFAMKEQPEDCFATLSIKFLYRIHKCPLDFTKDQ
jgi:hypothetical protein